MPIERVFIRLPEGASANDRTDLINSVSNLVNSDLVLRVLTCWINLQRDSFRIGASSRKGLFLRVWAFCFPVLSTPQQGWVVHPEIFLT